MRRLLILFAAVALLLLVAAPAAANNDPHRFPLGVAPPGEIGPYPDGPCAFAIDGVMLVGNQYESDAFLPDGTVAVRITGSEKLRLSANGKSIDVNVSGPKTATIHPDGTASFKEEGRQILAHPDLPTFGFPSRYVVWNGLFEGSLDASGSITSVSRMPHVDIDICAALS